MNKKSRIILLISIIALFIFVSYFSGISTSMRYYFSVNMQTNLDVIPTYAITYYVDGTVNSTLTPKTIQENTTITLPTPTKSGYVFYGWYRNSNYTGSRITTLSNQNSDVTLYAKFVQLPIIDGVSTATMTQEQAAQYYGKAVSTINGSAYNPNSSDTRTWRIFYIDTANKYGDGKGAIYLKADEVSGKTARFSSSYGATNAEGYTSTFGAVVLAGASQTVSNNRYYQITNDNVVSSSGTTINTYYLKLNPTYATGRKNLSRIFTESEKAAAFLCEPAKFTEYRNTSVAKYAIGSPTIEMWMDSWNGVYSSNYRFGYRWNTGATATGTSNGTLPGYQVKLNNDSWGQAAGSGSININTIDTTGMYRSTAGMWYASPSVVYQGGSLQRQSPTGFVGNATINMAYTFCPVVCLKMTVNVLTTTGANNNSINSLSLRSDAKSLNCSSNIDAENDERERQFQIELYRGYEESIQEEKIKENTITNEVKKIEENTIINEIESNPIIEEDINNNANEIAEKIENVNYQSFDNEIYTNEIDKQDTEELYNESS